MPLHQRLIHTVVMTTPTITGAVDDYNQPVASTGVTETMKGFLYPSSSREQAQANQAGTTIADYNLVVALRPDPAEGAWLRLDPDDGERYEVQGTDRHAYGRDPLLQIKLRRVQAATPATVA